MPALTNLIPRLVRRHVDLDIAAQARAEGFTLLQQQLVAARLTRGVIERASGGRIAAALHPTLRSLTPPDRIPDMIVAARRIAAAIMNGEHVVLSLDHDCDGVSAACVLYRALVEHFGASRERIHLLTTERLTEGYGFSKAYLARALAQFPDTTLIITADQGSSDESTIRDARALGVTTVVSDHHLLPTAGPPASALACVSPARDDAVAYGDPLIAGCMVAWLLMCQVRIELIACGQLGSDAPSLADLLQAVALGTTADAVSLGESLNNRAVVVAGLKRMNGPAPLPGLAALAAVSRRDPHDTSQITATHLAWDLAPRIAGAGRLDSAMPGAQLLLADDINTSARLARELDDVNLQRREVQAGMLDDAIVEAQRQVDGGARGIVIVFSEGHAGVHGICASRLVSRFGRPVACFSPKKSQPGFFSGSLRTIPGFHARDALVSIRETAPDSAGIVASGGHSAAAGCLVDEAHLVTFQAAFEREAVIRLAKSPVGPWFDTDGQLPGLPSLGMLEEIDAIAPFGRGYEAPLFEVEGEVVGVKAMGAEKQHLRVTLRTMHGVLEIVWFHAGAGVRPPPVVRAVVALSANRFRGECKPQLIAQAVLAAEK